MKEEWSRRVSQLHFNIARAGIRPISLIGKETPKVSRRVGTKDNGGRHKGEKRKLTDAPPPFLSRGNCTLMTVGAKPKPRKRWARSRRRNEVKVRSKSRRKWEGGSLIRQSPPKHQKPIRRTSKRIDGSVQSSTLHYFFLFLTPLSFSLCLSLSPFVISACRFVCFSLGDLYALLFAS